MNIKSFGGEFKLIEAIARKPKSHPVITSIGDDCAVLPFNKKNYQIITKDMLIEEDHFSLRYFEPEEIGRKVVESNISDIASMGGFPQYAFIGISLKKDTSVEWVKRLYKGMHLRFKKHKVDLIGGDTTHSSLISISLTIIGQVPIKKIVYRNGAKVGDIIKVSGKIGASTAGFKLLRKDISGHDWVKSKHKKPSSRLDIATKIAKYASAMTDISDGLAADIKNVMKMSKVGAIIHKEAIPVHERTFEAALTLKEDAYDFALHGGEDFELVYTVPKRLEKKCPGFSIGEIVKGDELLLKDKDQMSVVEKSGFNHFS